MFSYIKGVLVEIWEDTVVVEAGNIGWNIHVPLSVLDVLPEMGAEVRIYTSFQVREDSMALYGFLTRQDLQMFQQLLGVSGIGPKAALGILSVLNPKDLRIAIISEDAKVIARAPGIGSKTAKRVILELKDRIKTEDIFLSDRGVTAANTWVSADAGMADVGKEAMAALEALGYSSASAARAVHQVSITEDMTAETVLKASLKYLL